MTWNYYTYYVVDLTTEEVLSDCGENWVIADSEFERIKKEHPDHKIAIQQQHSVARIVRNNQ